MDANNQEIDNPEPLKLGSSVPAADRSTLDPQSEHLGSKTSPVFYWQLSPTELRRHRDANWILEDEVYLAHDINWGDRCLIFGPDT